MTNQLSRKRSTAGWTSTALVIGGLAVLGLALLIVPGWIAPAPTPQPLPSTSASAEVSFPPSPYRSIEWQVVTMGADWDGAQVNSLVEADGRLVAVGSRDGQPLAWWSDDGGATWTGRSMVAPQPVPAEGAAVAPRVVAASGSRVVAAGFWLNADGSAILGPAVWVSPDGRFWEAHDLSGAMPGATLDAIVGTSDGFYAVGHASDSQPFGWWRSGDGVSWELLDVGGLPSLAVLPPAVAWRPDVTLVAGGHGGGRMARPGIWAADPLPTFGGTLEFEETFDDEETWGWITALADADYGFVAVGQTVDAADDPTLSHLGAWISADGRSWHQLAIDSPVGTGASAVAANGSGAAILGRSELARSTEAWFLPGGAGAASAVRLPFTAMSIAALPDRFLVVGGCPPEDGCAGPMVAIGHATEDADPPAPTLALGD